MIIKSLSVYKCHLLIGTGSTRGVEVKLVSGGGGFSPLLFVKKHIRSLSLQKKEKKHTHKRK